MGLKEILAAKKAAQLVEQGNAVQETQAPTVGQVVEPLANTPAVAVHVETEALPTAAEQNNPAAPNVPLQKEPDAVGPVYPTHDANGKPLSGFHLIQAKKKVDAEWALKNQGIINVKQKEQVVRESTTAVEQLATTASSEQQSDPTSSQNASTNTTEQQSQATPEAEQAYSDLKVKLDALSALSEDNLKTAMQELKKALMANPNAVSLMLPSDIGQMVIALRKMTGVELAVANAKTTAGKASKKKEPILSAEDMEKAWQEL